MTVARAVLLTFEGPPPEEWMYALRRNKNVMDNRPTNLVWGFRTRGEDSDRRCCWCRGSLSKNQTGSMCSRCINLYNKAKRQGIRHESQKRVYAKEPLPIEDVKIIRRYLRGHINGPQACAERCITLATFTTRVARYRKENGIPQFTKEERRERVKWFAARKKMRGTKRKQYPENVQLAAAQRAIHVGAKQAAEEYDTTARSVQRWKKQFGLSGASQHSSTYRRRLRSHD